MFEVLEKLKLDDEYAIINRNSEKSICNFGRRRSIDF